MAECNLTKNRSGCHYACELCPRKGICCECLRHHLGMNEWPGARSLARFLAIHEGSGRP